MNLVKQEIWILMKRKTTLIALIVAIVGTIFTACIAINQNSRIMENDKIIQGKQVVLLKQQEQKMIEGDVTQEHLQAFLNKLYMQNKTTPMTLDEKINFLFEKDNVRYEPYVSLLLRIYGDEKDYLTGYTKLYEVGKQSRNVYQDWKEKVQTSLNGSSKLEADDVHETLNNIPNSFTFEAGEFIPCAIAKFQDLMLLIYIVITIIFASIFSKDRYTKTDQIILTTQLGTRKLRKAKCTASVLLSNTVFIGCVVLYNIILAAQIGVHGLSSSIQMNIFQLSPYSLTALQAYIDIILLAFAMCICITMLVIFASNRTKRAYTVILVTFILLFVSYMINSSGDTTLKLFMFSPFGLIDTHMIFRYCNVVIMGISIWFPWIVISVLLLFAIVLRIRIVHRG